MRSLADDLRSRSDLELAALLRVRPDLGHPVAADLGALAARAATPGSIAARLRDYDEPTLAVLLLCALAEEPITAGPVTRALVGTGELSSTEARSLVRTTMQALRLDAVLWGKPRALRIVGAARELLVPVTTGPLVAGVDPTVADYVRDPATLRALLTSMPDGARAALGRLLERPVVGTVVDPRRTPDPERSAVDWLLAHHLVVPFGFDRVVVPGEVVRLVGAPAAGSDPTQHGRGRELRIPRLVQPGPARVVLNPARAEAGSVAATIDVLHAVEEVGQLWTEEPPSRLRAGGVAVRDLGRTARHLGAGEDLTCLLLEVATAAGLLAGDNREGPTVLPTPAFDLWRATAPPDRMARLLVAWREMPRAVGSVNGEGARPLSDELTAPHLPLLRVEVLRTLARVDGDWSPDEVLEALRWGAPRLDWVAREPDVRDVLEQLRRLGVLVGGWLTTTGQALAGRAHTGPAQAEPGDEGPPGRPPAQGHAADSLLAAVTAALAATLPSEVDAVIIQGDLTAVVPGLPTNGLADLLHRTARAESRGVASVYRFSAESIRRALDAGATATQLLDELGRYGQVPQPLAYLVTDTARTHAALRVGAAATYLRCEDAGTLAAILHDPRASGLGLFPLTATVAASTQAPEHVLERLRALGHHPMVEPGGGLAVPPLRRARSRPTAEVPAPAMTPALATAAVRVMRAGDGAASAGAAGPNGSGDEQVAGTAPRAAAGSETRGGVPRLAKTESPVEQLLVELRSAIEQDRPVLLDYATSAGISTTVHLQPLRLARGYVTGLDLLSQSIETYSVARIRSLHAIDALG